MSIPEAQLDTWSKVGSQTNRRTLTPRSANALDDKSAPYAGSIDIFCKGHTATTQTSTVRIAMSI